MGTQQTKQQNASASAGGQSGWIPINAAANLDTSATSGNDLGAVVNLNGIQPTGSFGDPIDALFGGLSGLFGDGTATTDTQQLVPGFNVGPLLTVAVLGAIFVVVFRAVRKG